MTAPTNEELLAVNEELSALNRIVTACTASLRLYTVLERVLDEALAITGLEGGTICLVGKDDPLHLAAHRGVSPEALTDLTVERHAELLEERVRERTLELEAKNRELERVNRLFVGRELRMRELKERVRELEQMVRVP